MRNTRVLIAALAASTAVLGLAAGPAGARIYWSTESGKIQRSALDGTNVETLVSSTSGSLENSVTVDTSVGRMFWVERGTGTSSLLSATMNGSDVRTLLTRPGTTATMRGVAVNTADHRLYVTSDDGFIVRVDESGSNPTTIESGVSARGNIAIDPAAGKMYWANTFDGSGPNLFSASTGGGTVTTLSATAAVSPFGVAVDPAGGKLYWTQLSGSPKKIRRANLDGSSPEDVVNTTSSLDGGLTVDAPGGKIYWGEGAALKRADLTGANAETLSTAGAGVIDSVALDKANVGLGTKGTPTVNGTPRVAGRLTCDPGTWSGIGTVQFAYQWGRTDGGAFQPIDGATSRAYVPAADDQGHPIACQVTGTDNVESAARRSVDGTVAEIPAPQAQTPAASPPATTPPVVTPGQPALPLFGGIGVQTIVTATTKANVPVFTNTASRATLTATPKKAKAGKSKCKARTAANTLPVGRSSMKLTKLVRGCRYGLKLQLSAGDGQGVTDTAAVTVQKAKRRTKR